MIAANTTPLVELDGISVDLGERRILDRVSLSIFPNQRLGVFGTSGCGKSTLVRLISGMIKPSAGSMSFRGKPIWRDGELVRAPDDYRQSVCLLPQDGGLFPALTVRRNLELMLDEGLELKAQKLSQVLEKFGFDEELLLRYPDELSGGQRQRIAISRAILRGPQILMLDEPTSNLDPIAANQVRDTIRSLEDVSSMVIISHDIKFLSKECTHGAFIHSGSIVAQGELPGLLESKSSLELNNYLGSFE